MSENQERQDQILAEMGRLVAEIVRLRNPEDDPIVVGWAGAYEWTSVRLEQGDRFGAGRISPAEQSGSMTYGLLSMGARDFGKEGDDE